VNPREQAELELNEATERARKLVDDTPARLFTVRPSVNQWSAAECLSHLSLSTELFVPVLRKTMDDARSRHLTADGVPRMDMLGRILRWFLEPPVRSRVKTKPAFVPKAIRAKAEALAEFTRLQKQLVELLQSSSDVPIGRLKLVSPFDSRIKYNVYSAFMILTAHQRRHLWQAEQAVAVLRRG
jgi:hypothetical protein